MKGFNVIFEKTRRAVVQALRQGLGPGEIAWALAAGILVGLFPIYGTTMLLLGLIGHVMGWNHVLLQSANWLVSPLKPLLILPHIRLGEWALSASRPFELSLAEFTLRFQDAPVETFRAFSMTFVHAIAGWFVHAPFSILIVYLLARRMLAGVQSGPEGTPS